MKNIFTIASLLLSWGAFAQQPVNQPTGAPNVNIHNLGAGQFDSVVYLPNRDTTFTPVVPSAIIVRQADGLAYLWTGGPWKVLGQPVWGRITGSLPAQTDLYDSLLARQRNLTNGYGWFINGTAGTFDSAHVRKVDSMYRVNDSTIGFRINGIPYTTLLRGTAAGGISSLVLTVPTTIFSSPVTFTSSGGAWTGLLALQTQSANAFFAGPVSGSATTPTFRAMVIADLPTGIPNANLANSTIGITTDATTSSIGFSGSSVALGGTILLHVPFASATTSGQLSSTDWNRFNSGSGGNVISVNGQIGVVSTRNADSLGGYPINFSGFHNGYVMAADTLHSQIIFESPSAGSGTVTAVSISNDSLYYATASGNTFVGMVLTWGDSTFRYVTPTQLAAGLATKLSTVSTVNSATGNGTAGSPVQLVGDVNSPGNSFYYGTNGSGAKGYYTLPSGITAANPTATVQLSPVNGSAVTFMRSDAAPSLSQAIAPTWTGLHIFNSGLQLGSMFTFTTDNSYKIGTSTVGASQVWARAFESPGAVGLASTTGNPATIYIGATPGITLTSGGQGQLNNYTTSTSFPGTLVALTGTDGTGLLMQPTASQINTFLGAVYDSGFAAQVAPNTSLIPLQKYISGSSRFIRADTSQGNPGAITTQASRQKLSDSLQGLINAHAGDSGFAVQIGPNSSTVPLQKYISGGARFIRGDTSQGNPGAIVTQASRKKLADSLTNLTTNITATQGLSPAPTGLGVILGGIQGGGLIAPDTQYYNYEHVYWFNQLGKATLGGSDSVEIITPSGESEKIPQTIFGLTANPLSQFASTTSAQLAGVLSNETGTGLAVFNNGPQLLSPVINTSSTPGYVWTATNGTGSGSWQAAAGGGGDVITTPNSTLVVGGTSTNTTLDVNPAPNNILGLNNAVRLSIGQIVNLNGIPSLGSLLDTGSVSPTFSGPYMILTNGSSTFAKAICFNSGPYAQTASHQFKASIKYVMTGNASAGTGPTLGLFSTNTFSSCGIWVQVTQDGTGSDGKLTLYGTHSNSSLATSSTNLANTHGDSIVLTLERINNVFVGTAWDQATNSAVDSVSFTVSTAASASAAMPNTAHFAFGSSSATPNEKVDSFAVSSYACKYCQLVYVDNSKGDMYDASNPVQSWTYKLAQHFTSVGFFPAQADRTTDVINRIAELVADSGSNYMVGWLGRNDQAQNGISDSTNIKTRYQSIITTLSALPGKIWLATPVYESTLTQVWALNWLYRTYPASQIIDMYHPTLPSNMLNTVDNIHPNDGGHQAMYKAALSAFDLPQYTNSTAFNGVTYHSIPINTLVNSDGSGGYTSIPQSPVITTNGMIEGGGPSPIVVSNAWTHTFVGSTYSAIFGGTTGSTTYKGFTWDAAGNMYWGESIAGSVTNPALWSSNNNLIIGASSDPNIARLEGLSTTLPGLASLYDATHYTTIQPNSSGNATITTTGGTINLAGTPTAATAAAGTNTTQIATTAFVTAAVSSGTYTSTLTNTTNITSSTVGSCTYTRIGNIVHVNIACLVTPTTASTASVLTFTLPITTSNGSQNNNGLAALEINSSGVATYTSGVVSLASTTTGTLSFICTSLVGTSNVNIQFDYFL
jgi:hypothetical protein